MIGTDDLQYDTRYRYRVRWSIPTRRLPIPRFTASVYFTITVSKIKPKVRHIFYCVCLEFSIVVWVRVKLPGLLHSWAHSVASHWTCLDGGCERTFSDSDWHYPEPLWRFYNSDGIYKCPHLLQELLLWYYMWPYTILLQNTAQNDSNNLPSLLMCQWSLVCGCIHTSHQMNIVHNIKRHLFYEFLCL